MVNDSRIGTLVRHECERLARMGYGYTVTPCILDGAQIDFGNDVLVGEVEATELFTTTTCRMHSVAQRELVVIRRHCTTGLQRERGIIRPVGCRGQFLRIHPTRRVAPGGEKTSK